MRATKLFASVMLALAAAVCSVAQDASPPAAASSAPTSSQASPQASPKASSQNQVQRPVHHIQVPDEDSPAQPAELTEAEAAIEKKNYSGAESLLRKLVEHDPANYAGWFDLGFVENVLGKVDDSIAAYRKSVAAKPDVFESNLNQI